MPWIIDGNNAAQRLLIPEQALIARLSALSESGKLRIELFFDGERASGQTEQNMGKLRIRYSGVFSSADDRIVEFVRVLRDKSTWCLISDDRSLGREVHQMGLRVEKIEWLRTALRDFSLQQTSESRNYKPSYEARPDDLLQAMLHRNRTPKK